MPPPRRCEARDVLLVSDIAETSEYCCQEDQYRCTSPVAAVFESGGVVRHSVIACTTVSAVGFCSLTVAPKRSGSRRASYAACARSRAGVLLLVHGAGV